MELCRCAGRDGFTRLPASGDFVCASCHLPKIGYEKMASGGLAFFRGGPLDGQAYEYDVLLTTQAITLPINEYRWTTEKITSSVTGNTARVWAWKNDE